MFKMPLVSFIVTSYNYERYILKTLESIKSQTYSNFEIII
ncbi:glycosyltransferase, partial [bacterium]|nr:glycosyltransferase [bacterium]